MKKDQTEGALGAENNGAPSSPTPSASGGDDDGPRFSVMGMRVSALENLTLCLLAELETLHEGGRRVAAEGALDFYAEVREFETQMIAAALRQAGGKQVEAARLLKLKPSTLNSKLKLYNLRPKNPARPHGLLGQDGGGAGQEPEGPAGA